MKKNRILFILVLFVLLFKFASCELNQISISIDKTIVGRVIDQNKQPVDSVMVELLPYGDTMLTDSKGVYEFTNLTDSIYTLRLNKKGYNEKLYDITILYNEGVICLDTLYPSLLVQMNNDTINEIDFASDTLVVERGFDLFNSGKDTLNWKISYDADWISGISSSRGVIYPNETINLKIDIDRSKLKLGTNKTMLEIYFGTGSLFIEVRATKESIRIIKPEIKTLEPTIKGNGEVSLNASVIKAGDPSYSECGFVYGLLNFPTIGNGIRIPVLTHGEGEYSSLLTSLEEGKTYYYRAYAVVENEVIYGDVFQFIMDSPFVTRLEYANLMVINEDLGTMNWNDAFDQCNSLSYGGYDDWYLPEIAELNLVYNNKDKIGGFKSTCYWSSSVDGSTYLYKKFDTYCMHDTHHTYDRLGVRCVRKLK